MSISQSSWSAFTLLLRVAHAHAGTDIALNTIGRDRITQAVLRQRLHAHNRLGEMFRLQGHQHLLVRYAAIAPFGIAWQGQAGLTALERPAPGIGASGLADHAPFELLVSGILQPIDQDDHLPRRRIDETDVRRVEPAARQRADCERLILPERNHIQRLLALACVLGRAVPDPDIVFAGEPFLILRYKTDHGAALRADEIVGGDADGPPQTRRHADDLVGGVD